MNYLIAIIGLVAIFILKIVEIFIKKKSTKILVVIGMFILFITTIVSISNMQVPQPEIYTSNGNNLNDNYIYIKSQPFFKVYYTLEPYNDPRENGKKYKNQIPIESSMTISAKSTFFDIFWSNTVTLDIVVGDKSIEVEDVIKPGSSIQALEAYLTREHYYTGDILEKTDLHVEGKTIDGDNIVISDFEFIPNILQEGKNVINITYKNLEYNIIQYVTNPKLTNIHAEYIGNDIYVGQEIQNSDFKVEGYYDNGLSEDISDFQISPNVFEESGKNAVTVNVENINTKIIMDIKPYKKLVQIVDLDGEILSNSEILLEDEETKILEKIYTDENGYADFEQKDFGKKKKVYKREQNESNDNIIVPIGYVDPSNDNVKFIKPQIVASIQIVDNLGHVYSNSEVELINVDKYGKTYKTDAQGYVYVTEFDLVTLTLDKYTNVYTYKLSDDNVKYLNKIGYTMLEGQNAKLLYD